MIDPPKALSLSPKGVTASSIRIEWKRDRNDNNTVTGE